MFQLKQWIQLFAESIVRSHSRRELLMPERQQRFSFSYDLKGQILTLGWAASPFSNIILSLFSGTLYFSIFPEDSVFSLASGFSTSLHSLRQFSILPLCSEWLFPFLLSPPGHCSWPGVAEGACAAEAAAAPRLCSASGAGVGLLPAPSPGLATFCPTSAPLLRSVSFRGSLPSSGFSHFFFSTLRFPLLKWGGRFSAFYKEQEVNSSYAPDEALKHFLSMRKEVKGSVLISALCFFQTAVNSYNCATRRKHPGQGRKEGGEKSGAKAGSEQTGWPYKEKGSQALMS